MARYFMDAIHLSGNVWIKCLYAQGKMPLIIIVAWPQDVSMWSMQSISFDTEVYVCLIYIRKYLIVG